jgi:SAM-dependent methyltransferase
MAYRCVRCGTSVAVPPAGEGNTRCPSCQVEYRYGKNYLKYDCDELLFTQFKKNYLLYKVLSNNAYLAYRFIQEGSLSCSERQDVSNFRNYILSHVREGKILDVGCGILDVPGYLDFDLKEGFEFYGIDPIDDRSFRGVRIIGCAEFMPFPDGFFDAVVFATSLDHVCSLEQTLREVHRVLSQKGKVLLWMADPTVPWAERAKDALLRTLHRLRAPSSPWTDISALAPGENIRIGDFAVYSNLSVFQIPKGAVDPFHVSYESPRRVISVMEQSNMILDDLQHRGRNEVFLCFRRGD